MRDNTKLNETRRDKNSRKENREGKHGERAKGGKRGGMRVGEGWTGR